MIGMKRWIYVGGLCCALTSTAVAEDAPDRNKPQQRGADAPAQEQGRRAAQKGQSADAHGGSASAQQSQAQKQQTGEQQLSGKIKESRQTRVGTSKGSQTNRVVLLETEQGKTIVVDLGSEAALRDVQVKRGTPVQVSGIVVNVEGDPVFMAKRLKVGGRTVTSQRSAPDESRRPNSQSFTGTITKTKEMGIKGTDKKHRVAVLETSEDRKLLVDLGPTEQLAKLDIESGDKVRIQGFGTNINERRVLIAQMVEKGGKSTQIQREALPQNIDLQKGGAE